MEEESVGEEESVEEKECKESSEEGLDSLRNRLAALERQQIERATAEIQAVCRRYGVRLVGTAVVRTQNIVVELVR